MGKSLADYVDTSVIKKVQDLYSTELDLPTAMTDAEGRINLVDPSNMMPFCGDLVRGCLEGMEACMESERGGRDLLSWALQPSARADGPPSLGSVRFINWIRPMFAVPAGWHPPIGVVYFCKVGLVDFAVPVFDPGCGEPWKLLSIVYSGQYITGDGPLGTAVAELATRIRALPGLAEAGKAAEPMLHHQRRADWNQLVVMAHVIYALSNAMVRLGQASGERLSWSPEAILRVYFEAFRVLSGARNGCLVRHDRWLDRFNVCLPCTGFQEESCHRNAGRLFARLRDDPTLEYVAVGDTAADPWWVGQTWVKQNYAFAVRSRMNQPLAIVNLNLEKDSPSVCELCVEAMVHLARQIGLFLEVESFLRPGRARLAMSRHYDRVTRGVPADTGALCKHVAQTLPNGRGSPIVTRKCLVWLVDEADYSERQVRGPGSRVLSCYAITDCFPVSDPALAERLIPDVPVDESALQQLLDVSVLTCSELRKIYPSLSESAALGPRFVGIKEGEHHLAVLPIRAEGGPDGARLTGLLMVVDRITFSITEEDRQAFQQLCYRLHDALQMVAERNRREVELAVGRYLPKVEPGLSKQELEARLRAYLSKAVREICDKTNLEGALVFLREGFPDHDPGQPGPIVLWAIHSLRAAKGDPPIYDVWESRPVPRDQLDQVRFAPGVGATGFSACQAQPVRVSDIRAHRDALNKGSVGEPPWQGRWSVSLTPDVGRKGIICAPLKDSQGRVFGLLRASSRRDSLRLTQIDEDSVRNIVEVLSQQVDLFMHQAQLARKNVALASLARTVEVMLRVPVDAKDHATSLQRAILVPILLPGGFGLGRAAYCELRAGGHLVAPVALGGLTEEKNREVRRLAVEHFEETTASTGAETETPYQKLWTQLHQARLTGFRDRFEVRDVAADLEGSQLGAAIRTSSYRIVDLTTPLDPLDAAVMNLCQGGPEHAQPFAYISIKVADDPQESLPLLYVDSPFPGDRRVTEEAVKAIWIFGSFLGGISAARTCSFVRRATSCTFGTCAHRR